MGDGTGQGPLEQDGEKERKVWGEKREAFALRLGPLQTFALFPHYCHPAPVSWTALNHGVDIVCNPRPRLRKTHVSFGKRAVCVCSAYNPLLSRSEVPGNGTLKDRA